MVTVDSFNLLFFKVHLCYHSKKDSCDIVNRACYGVLRFIMESGAKGCEVVVSGKLRGQRAKSMKFVDGLMIHSGDPTNHYVDMAIRHVYLRQGMSLVHILPM